MKEERKNENIPEWLSFEEGYIVLDKGSYLVETDIGGDTIERSAICNGKIKIGKFSEEQGFMFSLGAIRKEE